MKSMIVVALALVAIAAALPVENEPQVVQEGFEKQPEGGYKFGYKLSDGTGRKEYGELKEVLDEELKPQKVVVVRGSYTYTDGEGVQETIEYEADENGFRAVGPSIPQPPARR